MSGVNKLTQEIARELVATTEKILAPGKGILAVDEPPFRMDQRFAPIGAENSYESRATWRSLLFTSEEIEKNISGAILHEETLFQDAPAEYGDGKKIVDLLTDRGIVPGIKNDKGLITSYANGDKSTEGLDSMRVEAKKFYEAGARFTKFRCVLNINATQWSILSSAHTLARYATICQSEKLVPIVEPEILTDGSHSIEACAKMTEIVLAKTFKVLHDQGVLLEGCLLKPNMVTKGADYVFGSKEEEKDYSNQVAFYTVRSLMRTVPPALAGVVFLSGGQSEEDASIHLSLMNSLKKDPLPWVLTFSYGRALQASALKIWGGKEENKKGAQDKFMERAKANGAAQLGKYVASGADSLANESLHVANYSY